MPGQGESLIREGHCSTPADSSGTTTCECGQFRNYHLRGSFQLTGVGLRLQQDHGPGGLPAGPCGHAPRGPSGLLGASRARRAIGLLDPRPHGRRSLPLRLRRAQPAPFPLAAGSSERFPPMDSGRALQPEQRVLAARHLAALIPSTKQPNTSVVQLPGHPRGSGPRGIQGPSGPRVHPAAGPIRYYVMSVLKLHHPLS